MHLYIVSITKLTLKQIHCTLTLQLIISIQEFQKQRISNTRGDFTVTSN